MTGRCPYPLAGRLLYITGHCPYPLAGRRLCLTGHSPYPLAGRRLCLTGHSPYPLAGKRLWLTGHCPYPLAGRRPCLTGHCPYPLAGRWLLILGHCPYLLAGRRLVLSQEQGSLVLCFLLDFYFYFQILYHYYDALAAADPPAGGVDGSAHRAWPHQAEFALSRQGRGHYWTHPHHSSDSWVSWDTRGLHLRVACHWDLPEWCPGSFLPGLWGLLRWWTGWGGRERGCWGEWWGSCCWSW